MASGDRERTDESTERPSGVRRKNNRYFGTPNKETLLKPKHGALTKRTNNSHWARLLVSYTKNNGGTTALP
jgi:hypothetical protein